MVERIDNENHQLDANSYIMSYLHNKTEEAKEQLIKTVLLNLLKREPTIEDMKDVKIYKNSSLDYLLLNYNGIVLGKIIYKYNIVTEGEYKMMCGIEFEPVEPFK